MKKKEIKQVMERLKQCRGKIIITCTFTDKGANAQTETQLQNFSVEDTEVFCEYVLEMIEQSLVDNICSAIDEYIKKQ